MAQFANITITKAGLDMIAKSQAGKKLIFTKAKLGNGEDNGTSITDLTDLISPKLTANLTNVATGSASGHVIIKFSVDNSALDTGFFVREVGIFAKVGEDGTEQLYGYSNAGNYTNWLADKSTPIDVITVQIDLVVGNASEVSFISDKTIVYVSQSDLEAHNADTTAHVDVVGATASTDGVRGIVPQPKKGDNDNFLCGDGTWKAVGSSIADTIKGHKQPTMTALCDWSAINKALYDADTWESFTTIVDGVSKTVSVPKCKNHTNISEYNPCNTKTGIFAYGGDGENLTAGTNRPFYSGDILLKEDYTNYDRILFVLTDDGATYISTYVYDVWELQWLFENTYKFQLTRNSNPQYPETYSEKGLYWTLVGTKQQGTDTSEINGYSTTTHWRSLSQNCALVEIYGIKY